MFTVALVGRPNVGKSTLFNRLVGKKIALVDDRPGVTRDRREGFSKFDDFHFRLFDTAGFEDVRDDSLESRMRMQTEAAFRHADVIVLILDARAGVTPIDQVFAKLLRRSGRPVLLVANKAEGRAGEAISVEALRMGFGEPLLLSAEHGEGVLYLLQDLRERAEKIGKSELNNPVSAPKRPEFLPQAPDDHEEEEAEAETETEAGETDEYKSDDLTDDEDETLPDVEAAAAGGLDYEWVDAEGSVRVGTDRPLRIAVIGRPNAGKSTLINSILGEDRLLTGPEAGITRDSIGVDYRHDGKLLRIFDTAGVRKKAKVVEKLEKLSVADTLRAVRFAEIVIVLLDAENPFDKQDLQLIELVEREGRAVVLAINKWDIVTERVEEYTKLLKERVKSLLPQLRGLKPVFISGLSGRGTDKLFRAVFESYETWNGRVSTASLNKWLDTATQAHPPPLVSGRRVRIKYMTQIKTRPPTFVGFSPRAEKLPTSYRRYLINGIREAFTLPATPVRFMLRKTSNPYD